MMARKTVRAPIIAAFHFLATSLESSLDGLTEGLCATPRPSEEAVKRYMALMEEPKRETTGST